MGIRVAFLPNCPLVLSLFKHKGVEAFLNYKMRNPNRRSLLNNSIDNIKKIKKKKKLLFFSFLFFYLLSLWILKSSCIVCKKSSFFHDCRLANYGLSLLYRLGTIQNCTCSGETEPNRVIFHLLKSLSYKYTSHFLSLL